jgi:hypothetical protein
MHDLSIIRKRNHEIMVDHVETSVSMMESALEEREALDPFVMENGSVIERMDALEEERTHLSRVYDRLDDLFSIALVNLAENITGDRSLSLRLVKEQFADKGIGALDAMAHGEMFHVSPFRIQFSIDYGISNYHDDGKHSPSVMERAERGWAASRRECDMVERIIQIADR